MINSLRTIVVAAYVLFSFGPLTEASQQLLYIETKTGTDAGAGE